MKLLTETSMKVWLVFFIFSLNTYAQTSLPDLPVKTLEGESTSSHALIKDGVPVVFTFWSTTCKPCLQELEAFSEQWEEWQQKVSFKLVAVSVDDVRFASKVKTWATSNDWPFLVLMDTNQELKRALNVNAIPHLFIVDSKGKIVFSRIGYTPGSEKKVIGILTKL